MIRMKMKLAFLLPLGLAAACTPVVPPELANARRAYEQASRGPASQAAPAELHKAKESLDEAERAFDNSPKAQKTRDLAYIAERKAELADAIGAGEKAKQARNANEQDFVKTQSQVIGQARGEIARNKEAMAAQSQALGSERQARSAAEQKAMEADQRAQESDARAKAAQEALAKLAMVKQEERGLVITLSGSVLFASDKAELLGGARSRLDQVAAALLATKERRIVVEGYTDARGSDTHNLDLSRRRAEAVRAYIVSKGYEPDMITAQGLGKDRPVADNASAEGRANNRCVEIIIQPKSQISER